MYFGPGIISVPRETYQSKSMSLRFFCQDSSVLTFSVSRAASSSMVNTNLRAPTPLISILPRDLGGLIN